MQIEIEHLRADEPALEFLRAHVLGDVYLVVIGGAKDIAFGERDRFNGTPGRVGIEFCLVDRHDAAYIKTELLEDGRGGDQAFLAASENIYLPVSGGEPDAVTGRIGFQFLGGNGEDTFPTV